MSKIECSVCPFCRSPCVALVDTPITRGSALYYVECTTCNAMGPDTKTAFDAVILWNKADKQKEVIALQLPVAI